MNDNKKAGFGSKLGTLLTGAAVLYLVIWTIGWLLERKWGTILIIWGLWFFGAMVILGGALSVIAGNANLVDRAWPWVLFVIAAAVMTAIQWKGIES